MVQDWDSGVLDTNDEWRSRSVAGTRKQVRSSGRNDAANNERTKDVEEHESVDESVCSFGNVAARGLGFASRDGDEFGRHDKGKGRTNHGVPKPQNLPAEPVTIYSLKASCFQYLNPRRS